MLTPKWFGREAGGSVLQPAGIAGAITVLLVYREVSSLGVGEPYWV